MYSILPASVANELRYNRTVAARKYEHVTIMFSGIVGFSKFSKSNADAGGAIKIVTLLNTIYIEFDDIINKDNDVFKVCTESCTGCVYCTVTTILNIIYIQHYCGNI